MRAKLTHAELLQKFFLAITVALARRSATRAALLNPRETETAERNRSTAARQLAECLADDFARSHHEVTREAVDEYGEAILAQLRERRQ